MTKRHPVSRSVDRCSLYFREMFNFDGHVISQMRVFVVERTHQGQGMTYAVEKIGISKRDVFRASDDLLPDVLQHNVSLHDAELALIDRYDRAMATPMLAASTGFRIPHCSAVTIAPVQARIFR